MLFIYMKGMRMNLKRHLANAYHAFRNASFTQKLANFLFTKHRINTIYTKLQVEEANLCHTKHELDKKNRAISEAMTDVLMACRALEYAMQSLGRKARVRPVGSDEYERVLDVDRTVAEINDAILGSQEPGN